MEIGASFSHRHLKSLEINPLKALQEFKGLGLNWIRLGCYWDEIEPKRDEFDFSGLSPLLDFCWDQKINVVLTVGIKAPRFPEYYLPEWLKSEVELGKFSKVGMEQNELTNPLFSFLRRSISFLRSYPCIKVWQVENEPLDPTGENLWRIDRRLLAEEIALVRKADNSERRIMLNFGGVITFLPCLFFGRIFLVWMLIFSVLISTLKDHMFYLVEEQYIREIFYP
jgi:hypothetical protein